MTELCHPDVLGTAEAATNRSFIELVTIGTIYLLRMSE